MRGNGPAIAWFKDPAGNILCHRTSRNAVTPAHLRR
jgi:hypothetical protein